MTDLYEVLGVPADASEDAIRRAYRAAARREHPDVSPHPDAAARMTRVNHAFAVLGDPAARAGYDRLRRLPPVPERRATATAEPAGPPYYPWLRCERCGAESADLRFRVFVWVVSLLVRTWRHTTAGLWCGACRRRIAWRRSVASLLLGPWGIPRGPFATIGAVWVNARGGVANPLVDANFEAHLRHAGRTRGTTAAASAGGGAGWRVVLVVLLLAAAGAVVAAWWAGGVP